MPAAALLLLLVLLATAAPGPAALAEEDETVVGPDATQLSIERRVEGEAPAGIRFVVALACEELDRIEFDVADGEVRSLPVPQDQACELTEVDDGGAVSMTIAVGEGAPTEGRKLAFSTEDHAELAVVVTSRFAPDPPDGGGDAVADGATGPGADPAPVPDPRPRDDDTGVRDAAIPTPTRVDAGGGALAGPPPGAALAATLVAVMGLAGIAVAALRRRRPGSRTRGSLLLPGHDLPGDVVRGLAVTGRGHRHARRAARERP